MKTIYFYFHSLNGLSVRQKEVIRTIMDLPVDLIAIKTVGSMAVKTAGMIGRMKQTLRRVLYGNFPTNYK